MFELGIFPRPGPRTIQIALSFFSIVSGAGCKADCHRMAVDQSLDGPLEATQNGQSLIAGDASIVAPGVNNPDGRLLLIWQASSFRTRLMIPDLRFGQEGMQAAEALGTSLCWCPDRQCADSAPNGPGVRCMELVGVLELRRYQLVNTDLGQERDIDILLDATGADQDASSSMKLHLVLKDDLFTLECDRFEDPVL